MYGFVNDVIAEKGRQVYTISAAATVRDAVHEMNEKGIGALVVLREGKEPGMFTERDVLQRVVDAGLHPDLTFVGEVMTLAIKTVPPSMLVEEAMRLMTIRRVRHLPVVDDGVFVGLVSIGDLMRRVTMHQGEELARMSEYIAGAAVLP